MAKQKERISRPGRRLILGFLLIILIGGIVLATPFTHNPGVRVSWLDALFVSTSAVCVTGLVPVDVAATFNPAGRTAIAILIQLGGLGFASIAIFFLVLFGKTIGASQRSLIKEALNAETGRGLIGLVKMVAIGATTIELVGAVALYTVFSKTYEPWPAIGMSLFHAVSAFNNAGFDLLGNFTSLTGYNTDIVLNCTIAILIVLGGAGFFCISGRADEMPLEKVHHAYENRPEYDRVLDRGRHGPVHVHQRAYAVGGVFPERIGPNRGLQYC